MTARTPRNDPRRPTAPARQRRGKGAPTRAQLQAMNARAAQTAAAETVVAADAVAAPTPAAPRSVRGEPGRVRQRTQSRGFVLPRAQEYAYIRGDMQRLLVIAAALLAVMVVLLLVVGR